MILVVFFLFVFFNNIGMLLFKTNANLEHQRKTLQWYNSPMVSLEEQLVNQGQDLNPLPSMSSPQ